MKKKILVADDDPAILDAISMILEDAGYYVETTANGETIKSMHVNLPDLLLLDIWMSGHDGREICKELKSQKRTRKIPIVMISASKDADEMAKKAGADDFIAKPFDIDELLERVEKYVK